MIFIFNRVSVVTYTSPLGGRGYLCSTIFCTLRRLPADNVSEDEFYSILKVTEIRYKVTQSMSPQNEPT